MNLFHKTAETLKQGAMALPREYYMAQSILDLETRNLFYQSWICCGRSNDIEKTGTYIMKNVGDESIIILRDDKNKLRAFYNICRHRGTRICTNEKGKFPKTIQCPYHGWTYNLQGNLCGAPNMDAVEKFNKDEHPLHSTNIIEWEGFIFINLSDNPGDFYSEFRPLKDRFSEWDMETLKTIDMKTYHINCNWKLIVQNYSECYHCPLVHPSLAELTPYTGGRNDLTSGPFLGGYMEMKAESITHNAKLCSQPIGNLSKKNLSRVYYYTLFPNMLLSLHPDYIMFHIIWPCGPQQCKIDCSWLFHEKAKEYADYQPQNAINFWHKTNQEDWEICEQSQLGVQSKKYKPGPYSGQESLLAAYDEYYLSLLNG